jgi:hypothetical protein
LRARKNGQSRVTSGNFYFLVVFDSKENAVFPETPYTAAYGIEEDAMIHIRALYTFNQNNGYSQLSIYKENMWERKADSMNIL